MYINCIVFVNYEDVIYIVKIDITISEDDSCPDNDHESNQNMLVNI